MRARYVERAEGQILGGLAVIVVVIVTALAPLAQAGGAMRISPRGLNFGNQPFGSFTTEVTQITNTSSETLFVTIDTIDVPDDFSPGQPESTCFLSGVGVNELAPGESCTEVIAFQPDPFFRQPESATLLITATDASGAVVSTVQVRIRGKGV